MDEHNGRYILEGHEPVPCPDLMQWGRWFEAARGTRQVAQTVIGKATVSTVFMALDHAFGSGPPLLFETMVFGSERWEDEMERYATWEEAEEGHKAMVLRVRESS